MQDTDQNYQAFLKGLALMSEYFSDSLTQGRQEMYWQTLQPKVTLDEWEYACLQAIERETFHKVPLVAVLMNYVREYRRAQRELQLQEQCAQGVQSRSRLLALRESLVDRAEVEALIASVWPEGLAVVDPGTPKPLAPKRRWRLTEEQLHYEPTTDADEAKTRAREQLRAVLDAQAEAREQQRQKE